MDWESAGQARPGMDQYTAEMYSQGSGGPRGFGLILDEERSDRYTAYNPATMSRGAPPGVKASGWGCFICRPVALKQAASAFCAISPETINTRLVHRDRARAYSLDWEFSTTEPGLIVTPKRRFALGTAPVARTCSTRRPAHPRFCSTATAMCWPGKRWHRVITVRGSTSQLQARPPTRMIDSVDGCAF